MVKNRVYETMTCFSFARFKIRLWTKALNFAVGPIAELPHIQYELNKYVINHRSAITHLEIVMVIEGILEDSLAAIEVLDGNGNGGLVYPDWN